MTDIEDVLIEMALLRTSFIADVPNMLAAIEGLLQDFHADPRPDVREHLIRKVHSLAGTSETFGLADIGQAARQLEHLIEAGDAAGTSLYAAELMRLRHLTSAALAGST